MGQLVPLRLVSGGMSDFQSVLGSEFEAGGTPTVGSLYKLNPV
jgi:hypothetical protein